MKYVKEKSTNRSRRTSFSGTRQLLKAVSVALSVLFILSMFSFALPAKKAAAARDYSTVRVNLKTNNATVLKIKAKGQYTITENGTTISGQEFTVKSSSGKVEVIVSDKTVFSGTECNIVPKSIDRSAGYLSFNNLYYLGEFRVKVRDNSYIQIINSVPMAYYLYGVLAGEMSDAYPLDALRSQALAAKGFVISKMTGDPNYDIGDTSAEQVYKGYSSAWTNIMQAVDSTISEALVVNGSYLKTYYSASNGGETQLPQYQWNGMSSSITAAYSLSLDSADIENPNSKLEKVTVKYGTVSSISPEMYTMISTEAAKNTSSAVTDVLSIHSAELYSPRYEKVTRNMTMFKMDVTVVLDHTTTMRTTISFAAEKLLSYGVFSDSVLNVYWGEANSSGYTMYHGRYGHGVGLSQRGAQQRAKNGDSYKQILKFYYPGAEIGSVSISAPTPGSTTTPPQTTTPPSTNTPAPTQSPTTAPTSDPTMPPPAYTTSPAPDRDPNTTNPPTTTTPPAGEEPNARPEIIKKGTVNASGVNLRTGPGLNYAVIVRLAKNTALDIYDMSNPSWYFVGTSEYTGYISSRYVDIKSGSSESSTQGSNATTGTYKTGYVNAVDVNFRTGPGTSYESMGRIAKNTALYVWGTEGEWSYIQIGVRYGYMFSQYVSVTGEHDMSELDGNVWASGVVKSDAVNLRQGPSTEHKVITTLTHGTKLLIYGEVSNGWLNVAANGQRGYVSSAYVTIESVNPQAPATGSGDHDAPMGTGYTTATDVNFRMTPSTSSKIITKLPKTAKLVLYALDNGWYEVEYSGNRGYVYALYVREESGSANKENKESTAGNESSETGNKTKSLTLTLAKSNGKLNFREGASMDAHVMEVFNGGEKFEIIGERGDWYYVLHGGVYGYVYKAYTTIIESGSAPIISISGNWSAKPGKTGATVNIRTGAALTTSVITTLSKGKDLQVLAQAGEWYLIRTGDICGFAFAEYVKI